MNGSVLDDDGVPRYFGKYPGKVVTNKPERGQQHRGELVVEVPGLLEERPKGEGGGRRPLRVTARPCLPPGSFWLPAEGQPVWVEFAAGLLDAPLWSGVWYPRDATPRTVDGDLPDEGHQVLRTPGGLVFELDDINGRVILTDAAGSQVTLHGGTIEIRIADKDDSQLRIVRGSATVTIDKDEVTITDGHDNHIAMKEQGGPAGGHYIELNGTNPVVLSKMVELFENHMHVTAMGPAALSPADVIALNAAKAQQKLQSQLVTVG